MFAPVLKQLATLCREYPAAAKVVFVPSPQVGRNLGIALAREGCGWVNLQLITPLQLAESMVGPLLSSESWQRIGEDARLLLIGDLLEELLEREPDSAFASLPRASALGRAFASTFKSLRIAGVSPDELSARLVSGKGQFVGGLYQSFVQRLHEDRLLDDAAVFERAVALVESASPAPENVYATLDETAVPGIVGRFVSLISGDRLVRLGKRSDAIPPSHMAARCFDEARYRAFDPVDGGCVRRPDLRTAIGSDAEVREILREITVRRIPLDEVEVAYTSENPYLCLIVDLADRFDLHFTYASGVPAALTRPGQALIGFLDWIAGGFAAVDLIATGQAGLLDPILPRDGERALRGFELARVIRTARVRRGREQYLRQLTQLEEALSQTTDRPRDVTNRTVRLAREAVQFLMDLLPPDATCTYSEMAKAGSAFLRQFARVSSDRDGVAIESLDERLRQIGTANAAPKTPELIASRIVELLRSHKVGASAARPGAAHVAPLGRAGYTGRPYLFVTGMDERSFPGVPIEDPLLLDEERAVVSQDLNLLRSSHSEQIWHLERLLETSPNVVLHSARYAVAEGQEVHSSAFFRRLAGDGSLVHEAPLVPPAESALDRTELALALRDSRYTGEQIDQWYPNLARGYFAVGMRRMPGFSSHHGWIGERLPPELVPGQSEPVSISTLETLAECPYRYFLRHVLGVRPPETPEFDPSRWLTALESGSLLHELFRRFMTWLHERGEKSDVHAHEPILMGILEEIIGRYLERIPYDNQAAFETECRRLRRAARIFIRAEACRSTTPVGFEVSFGEGRSEGLSRPEPVEVVLSDRTRLLLRGRIDRIDRENGGYQLWDYKSGSASSYHEWDLLDGGTRLQWVLYAHAFERMLLSSGSPGYVTSSGYYFPGERGNGQQIQSAPLSPVELDRELSPLLEMASAGALLHVQKQKSCGFCDFASVCNDESVSWQSIVDAYQEDSDSIPPELPFRDALLRWTRALDRDA